MSLPFLARRAGCVFALLTSLAWRAGAVDGVVEINGASATSGGVTASDLPGYPVTLDQPGSYRLTGNLTVAADVTAIEVVAGRVAIDLNGFTIQGPTSCTGVPVTGCQPAGLARGIDAAGQQAVTIENGTIRGFGNGGLLTGTHGRIRSVIATSNGSNGIQVGSGSILRACAASQNGASGLMGSVGVVIESSTSDSNGTIGIRTGGNSVVTGSTASSNGADGFLVLEGSSVRGSAASANRNAGISTVGASLAVGNTVSGNAGPGLSMGTGSGYLENVLVDNNGGAGNPQVNGGTDEGTNICVGGAN